MKKAIVMIIKRVGSALARRRRAYDNIKISWLDWAEERYLLPVQERELHRQNRYFKET